MLTIFNIFIHTNLIFKHLNIVYHIVTLQTHESSRNIFFNFIEMKVESNQNLIILFVTFGLNFSLFLEKHTVLYSVDSAASKASTFWRLHNMRKKCNQVGVFTNADCLKPFKKFFSSAENHLIRPKNELTKKDIGLRAWHRLRFRMCVAENRKFFHMHDKKFYMF